MRRVCWTADFAEANIVVGLLRANGIEAMVFDAGMAQLNWMQTLAIGGYRIMVSDADAQVTRDLLAAYRNGELEIPDGSAVPSACPDCGACRSGKTRNLRGPVFFLAWLGLGDLLLVGLVYVCIRFIPPARAVPQAFFILCTIVLSAVFLLLLHWLKYRHRCNSCAGTWQARASEFQALSRAVDDAEPREARSR